MIGFEYIFPFGEIEKGSRIVIYGAATMGIEYYRQVVLTGYCTVAAFLDKNAKGRVGIGAEVLPPSEISRVEYDYVVIAMRSGQNAREAERILNINGVRSDCIIHKIIRADSRSFLIDNNCGAPDKNISVNYAYETGRLSIAIIHRGGIGDMFPGKKVAEAVCSLFPEAGLDVYSDTMHNIIRYLYSEDGIAKNIIQNEGYRFSANCDKYDLAIEIQSYRYIKIHACNDERLKLASEDSYQIIKRLQKKLAEEDTTMETSIYALLKRRMLAQKDYYSFFSYDGILPVHDKIIGLPKTAACAGDLPEKYITVNSGSGVGPDGRIVCKAWPQDYFVRFVKLFRDRYPGVGIIQLGDSDCSEIDGVDRCIFGADFTEVAAILSGAVLHLDIEGGLVHLATHLGTRCAVLFGPTPIEYFGYDSNINITAQNCEWCIGLYRDTYKCAKGYDNPRCMYSITPEMVLNRIKDEINLCVEKK